MQESELAAMKWFDMSEVEEMPIFKRGVFQSVLACCKAYLSGEYAGLAGTLTPNLFMKTKELLLHGPEIIASTDEG